MDEITRCKNEAHISLEVYEKIAKVILKAFDKNNLPTLVLDYESLSLFSAVGIRSLSAFQFSTHRLPKLDKNRVIDVETIKVNRKNDKKNSTLYCPGCGQLMLSCKCHGFIEAFLCTYREMCKSENCLKILAEAGFYKMIKEVLTIRVEEECKESYFDSHLDILLSWLESLGIWVEILSSKDQNGTLHLESELQLFLHEIVGTTIISELFPIIVEFPESKPILDDLKACLRKVPLRKLLVSSLKSALEKRLLNPGVNTSDLLDAYVATVRTLKYIDPSGILVQLVTPPIREYLKCREETVRVVLISLTAEAGELAGELTKAPSSSSRDFSNWEEWNPDPIDVPKDENNLRKSDLIQTILSIYGSKTLFMEEYRALLADRLLRLPKPRPITHEIKCLELLKLRFGETDLQKCEVMLKDVADSHRLNVRFHEEEGAVLAHQDVPLTGLVISSQFWPTLKQENVILPKPVETSISIYTKAFEMIKGNRSLEWQKHIGNVTFELEFHGTMVKFSTSPLMATVLWQFQEKDKLTLSELVTLTGFSSNGIKSKIGFWLTKGILKEVEEDIYRITDEFPVSLLNEDEGQKDAEKFILEPDIDSPLTSAAAQREAELEVFWAYIEGMLRSLESLPLSRIYSMLKLFATVECSLEDVQKFLDQKVGLGVLVYSNGNYKIPK